MTRAESGMSISSVQAPARPANCHEVGEEPNTIQWLRKEEIFPGPNAANMVWV
jgi:hypothetical protein